MHDGRLKSALFTASFALACGAATTDAPKAAAQTPSAPVVAAPKATIAEAVGANNVSRVKMLWEAAAGGFGRGVAVSTEVWRVAASSGTPIRLYDLTSGKPAGELKSCEVIRGGLAFAQRKLYAVCEHAVQAFDPFEQKVARSLEIADAKVTAAAFSYPYLALGHHDGVIRVYDLNGSSTTEIPVPGPPIDVKSISIAPDGSKVAVAWIQGSVWWWETGKPDVPHKLVRYENESDTVAFNRDATLFVEEGELETTTVWSFGGAPGVAPAERAKIDGGAWIKRLLFTRDSKWLIRGGSDGLDLAAVDGPQRIVLDSRGKVEDVAFDESGSRVAAIDRDGRLTCWGAL